jgi:hypothetical protein
MAIPEDDRIIRRTGGFRNQAATSMATIITAVVIIGMIMLVIMLPRAEMTRNSASYSTRTTVTPVVPRDMSGIPQTTPKQP